MTDSERAAQEILQMLEPVFGVILTPGVRRGILKAIREIIDRYLC